MACFVIVFVVVVKAELHHLATSRGIHRTLVNSIACALSTRTLQRFDRHHIA
jgi:hypothetical protein